MSPIFIFVIGGIFGWSIVPLFLSRRDKWRLCPWDGFMLRLKTGLLFGFLSLYGTYELGCFN